MSLNKGKHIVEEVNGIRCTIIEKGVSKARASFLQDLLSSNGFEVITEGEADQITIGVTDLVFNPVIAIYQMRLKTKDGNRVSPAYWEQRTSICKDEYWEE